MFNYSMLLNLSGISCLVVGAGTVGCRKALRLLEAGAGKVRMVAPSTPGTSEIPLRKFQTFERIERKFAEKDIDQAVLVFAATNDYALNHEIAAICKSKGLLCNSASCPDDGNFTVPASLKNGELNFAVGAGQAGPVLAKLICRDFASLAEKKYKKAVDLMLFARPLILALDLDFETRRNLLTGLAELSLDFSEKRFLVLKQRMEASLPPELNEEIVARIAGAKRNSLGNAG